LVGLFVALFKIKLKSERRKEKNEWHSRRESKRSGRKRHVLFSSPAIDPRSRKIKKDQQDGTVVGGGIGCLHIEERMKDADMLLGIQLSGIPGMDMGMNEY
jgi:hypothetical protein